MLLFRSFYSSPVIGHLSGSDEDVVHGRLFRLIKNHCKDDCTKFRPEKKLIKRAINNEKNISLSFSLSSESPSANPTFLSISHLRRVHLIHLVIHSGLTIVRKPRIDVCHGSSCLSGLLWLLQCFGRNR